MAPTCTVVVAVIVNELMATTSTVLLAEAVIWEKSGHDLRTNIRGKPTVWVAVTVAVATVLTNVDVGDGV